MKYPYKISEPKTVECSEKLLLEEKQRLVKSFPFNGEIYLPTSKIQLKDQVAGLRDVADLVSTENKNISRKRPSRLLEKNVYLFLGMDQA